VAILSIVLLGLLCYQLVLLLVVVSQIALLGRSKGRKTELPGGARYVPTFAQGRYHSLNQSHLWVVWLLIAADPFWEVSSFLFDLSVVWDAAYTASCVLVTLVLWLVVGFQKGFMTKPGKWAKTGQWLAVVLGFPLLPLAISAKNVPHLTNLRPGRTTITKTAGEVPSSPPTKLKAAGETLSNPPTKSPAMPASPGG
jgi:hypothetical protein